MLTIGRMILFFISSFGYWDFFRKRSKINVFFLPAFTVVLQISVLFLAGLLNCLIPAYILLFAIGLILAVYCLIKEKKQFFSAYINAGYIFLFCAFCLCIIALRGKIFTSYDTFSHWALAVKTMLQTNRFPNFNDTVITFQAYPLGSASFVYYFSKIISDHEWIQMLAQAYMMLCFILPIFKCVKKYKIFNALILLIFTNFILCFNGIITKLGVDTLLPLEGMAAVFFIFSECVKRDEEGEKVSIVYAIPFLCAAMQIKSSGIFFVLLACVVIIAAIFRYGMDWRKGVATCVSPFISLYLWQTHCSYVFSSALTSKHAMSVINYLRNFSNKTSDDISTILRNLFQLFIKEGQLYFFIAVLLIVTIITAIFVRQKWKKLIELWAVCTSIIVVYLLGMFFMYIFSMPGDEATSIVSFSRYFKTVLTALYYMIICFFIKMLSQLETPKRHWTGMLVAVLMLFAAWKSQGFAFETIFSTNSDVDVSERLWIEKRVSEYGITPEKSCIICTPDADAGYTYFLYKYIMCSLNFSIRVITDESELNDAANYDFLIFYDEQNEIIKEWVAKNYPEQTGQDVIVARK